VFYTTKLFTKEGSIEDQVAFMESESRALIVYPGAIVNYQEKVAFKIPPSIYPTHIDIKLFYDKELKEFRALCSQTSVIQPERRIRGLAALLEDQVPVPEATRQDSLVVGRVVPQEQARQVISRRAAEAARRAAGRANCRPVRQSRNKRRKHFSPRSQSGSNKPDSQQRTAKVPAGAKRTSGESREPGLLKKLCLGVNKETLKKINTSTVKKDNQRTVVQRIETKTTTRNIVQDAVSGERIIDKDPKEVFKKVEVSEKVTFEDK